MQTYTRALLKDAFYFLNAKGIGTNPLFNCNNFILSGTHYSQFHRQYNVCTLIILKKPDSVDKNSGINCL